MSGADDHLLQMVRQLAVMPPRDREVVLAVMAPDNAQKLGPILAGMVQERPSVPLQGLLREIEETGTAQGLTAQASRALAEAARSLSVSHTKPGRDASGTGVASRIDSLLARLGVA